MLVLDHTITHELWQDPLFWECVPCLENYREEAEQVAVQANIAQSSLKVKHSSLYTQWLQLLHEWAKEQPAKVGQLVDYIQQKRQHCAEDITLPLMLGQKDQVFIFRK
jgi:transketolase